MDKQNKLKISNILLINIGINIGCTVIVYFLLSLYHELFLSGEPWILMWVFYIILCNIIGIILSIILSPKVILTIIIYCVFILNSIIVSKSFFNSIILGIIFGNIISGVLVLLIINRNKRVIK
jgi:hypothetical protein